MAKVRKDLRGRSLRKGEVQRSSDKRYMYTYTDPMGRRKFIYANDLAELREKEAKLMKDQLDGLDLLWSSIFVTLMANKIGGLQFGIYRNCQISSRVFHTAVAALPLTKANRSDFE